MVNKQKIDGTTTMLLKNITSFPQNLNTALEHLEKLLSKVNLTVLISCHGDH